MLPEERLERKEAEREVITSSSSSKDAMDEQGIRKKRVEEDIKQELALKFPKKTRNPDTLRYVEKKLTDKGLHRMERHPADGLSLKAHEPPKSGHGGKFTWEGPAHDLLEHQLNPPPPALDPHDPNYVDDEQEQGAAGAPEEEDLVVGEVEVAKVAEGREGVSRIQVQSPLSGSSS